MKLAAFLVGATLGARFPRIVLGATLGVTVPAVAISLAAVDWYGLLTLAQRQAVLRRVGIIADKAADFLGGEAALAHFGGPRCGEPVTGLRLRAAMAIGNFGCALHRHASYISHPGQPGVEAPDGRPDR